MCDDRVIGAPIVTDNGEDYMTIAEAARHASKSENTIRYWIDQGLLTTYQRGYAQRPQYIRQAELDDLLKMRPASPPSNPPDSADR